jgi:hypothetical protein
MRIATFCAKSTAMSIIAMIVLAPAARLRAQNLYGSIVGTVIDASGAVVPAAVVKATDAGTG